MNKMYLVVQDFESFCERFSPWSIIYINLNGQAFPDDLWWDDSSSILEMWAYNINQLMCGTTTQCSLHFMDGDFYIDLTLKKPNEAQIICFGPHGKIVNQDTIDLLFFARQILSAIAKFQSQYSEYSDTRVIQNISLAAEKLRSSIKRCKGKCLE